MNLTSKRIAALLCLFFAFASSGADISVEMLPKGRPSRLAMADPREVRMGLAFADGRIQAAIGNYFSLFGLTPDEGIPWKMHVGLEGAGFFGMRSAEGRFPLETTDGLIGAYIEGEKGQWDTQFRFTHVSAHLADGSEGLTPIAYSREFMRLRLGFRPSDEIHLYSGGSFLINSTPKAAPWGLELGGTAFLPSFSPFFAPFVATDLKWREEGPLQISLAFQLGVALNNPQTAYRSFRLFYSYFNGTDPRGQFLDRTLTSHSFGLEMQI